MAAASIDPSDNVEMSFCVRQFLAPPRLFPRVLQKSPHSGLAHTCLPCCSYSHNILRVLPLQFMMMCSLFEVGGLSFSCECWAWFRCVRKYSNSSDHTVFACTRYTVFSRRVSFQSSRVSFNTASQSNSFSKQVRFFMVQFFVFPGLRYLCVVPRKM